MLLGKFSLMILLCGLTLFSFFELGIRINNSPSIPAKVFLSHPLSTLERGQYVTFKLPVSDVVFAKEIAGIPGDAIETKNHTISINGEPKGGIAEGFKPIPTQVIPQGFYLVLGSHKDSFDSRYEEFGLVPKEAIKEGLWLIF